MKLLIVGSRSITNFDLTPHIPTAVDTVISGGAGVLTARQSNMPIGVDESAIPYLTKRGKSCKM